MLNETKVMTREEILIKHAAKNIRREFDDMNLEERPWHELALSMLLDIAIYSKDITVHVVHHRAK